MSPNEKDTILNTSTFKLFYDTEGRVAIRGLCLRMANGAYKLN